MNIQELDAYNLDDAVKFNDQLNPRLWDSREHLHPEIKEKLLQIAEDFKESLGINDLDIKDIEAIIKNPPVGFAKRNYGSVEKYVAMMQSKLDKLKKLKAEKDSE